MLDPEVALLFLLFFVYSVFLDIYDVLIAIFTTLGSMLLIPWCMNAFLGNEQMQFCINWSCCFAEGKITINGTGNSNREWRWCRSCCRLISSTPAFRAPTYATTHPCRRRAAWPASIDFSISWEVLSPVQFLVVHRVDMDSIYLFICVLRKQKWVSCKVWGSETNPSSSSRPIVQFPFPVWISAIRACCSFGNFFGASQISSFPVHENSDRSNQQKD